MLLSLMLLPLAVAALVGSLASKTEADLERVKQVALGGTLLEALLSILTFTQYDLSATGFQLQAGWAETGLVHLSLGVDGLSIIFMLLTTLLTPVCFLASWDNIKGGEAGGGSIQGYFMTLLGIESLLVGVFLVCDLVMFYVYFEAVLVPLFLLSPTPLFSTFRGVWPGPRGG
jgi:NADH:ubiquinone oxidoreductase subunit 4 (subunit M)